MSRRGCTTDSLRRATSRCHQPGGNESADEDEQGGLGGVQAGEQAVEHGEVVTGLQEQVGHADAVDAGLEAAVQRRVLQRPGAGGAHRDDPPARGVGGEDPVDRLGRDGEPLAFHRVLRQAGVVIGAAEGDVADVVGDLGPVDAPICEPIQRRRAEVEAARRRRHRAFVPGVDRVVEVRHGRLGGGRLEVGEVPGPDDLALVVAHPVDDLGGRVGQGGGGPGHPHPASIRADDGSRVTQGFPIPRPRVLAQRDALPPDLDHRRRHAAGVHDQAVAGAQQVRQVPHPVVGHRPRAPVQHEQAGVIPVRDRLAGDGGLGEMKVKVGKSHVSSFHRWRGARGVPGLRPAFVVTE